MSRCPCSANAPLLLQLLQPVLEESFFDTFLFLAPYIQIITSPTNSDSQMSLELTHFLPSSPALSKFRLPITSTTTSPSKFHLPSLSLALHTTPKLSLGSEGNHKLLLSLWNELLLPLSQRLMSPADESDFQLVFSSCLNCRSWIQILPVWNLFPSQECSSLFSSWPPHVRTSHTRPQNLKRSSWILS